MNRNITFSIILLFILSSCGSKIESAKESLVGSWKIKEIFQHNPTTGLTVDDELGEGIFEFTETQCDYNFTFNSINKANTFEYDFLVSKENAGFIKVDRFDIVGEENYRVRFGDETSDAHQGATEITLEKLVENDSLAFDLIIRLQKN